MIELYANNAYSTLAATLSSSATSMSVASGTGSRFPSPSTIAGQFFRLTLTSASSPNTIFEIVYCTARSGDTLTIQRGQEGTTAIGWSIGDLCGEVPTKGMLNQFVQSWVGTDTGTPDAYAVSTPQHETSYYSGMMCTFTTLNSNATTNPTLDLNRLGAHIIKNANGSSLTSSQLPANCPITVQFNTDDSTWRLLSPLGLPTGLSANKSVVTDSVGRLTNATPTAAQINYLANWFQGMTEVDSGTGYINMPTGLKIQWGVTSCSSASTTVLFPYPFTNACLRMYVTEAFGAPPASAHQPTWYGVDSSTMTYGSATIYAQAWNSSTKNWVDPTSSSVIVCNWLAIGY